MAVMENQTSSLQLLYESLRANAVRNGSTTVYPDFIRIKHRLVNKRKQTRTIALANNLMMLKLTIVLQLMVIHCFSYDKPGMNRILVFCSLIGLIMLSKTLK